MQNFSDRTVAILRTFIPSLWGSAIGLLVVFLAGQGIDLDPEFVKYLEMLQELIVVGAIVGWYALMRKLEPRMPDWLRIIVLGAPKIPTYDQPMFTIPDGDGAHRAEVVKE